MHTLQSFILGSLRVFRNRYDHATVMIQVTGSQTFMSRGPLLNLSGE